MRVKMVAFEIPKFISELLLSHSIINVHKALEVSPEILYGISV